IKMDRKAFLKQSAALGLGLPFLSLILESCNGEIISQPSFETNFTGKVLVIGAGAAGLTAGHILRQNQIDFQIIEAAPVYGGRLKKDTSLADFPIDLGAEWIHVEPTVLADMLNDPEVDANVEFIHYTPKSIHNYHNGRLKKQNWANNFYAEYKFKNTTWFGFFEKFIVPNIADKITLNEPVTSINYQGNEVVVQTSNGTTFTGDKVLITVPITILQDEVISFTPALSTEKKEAINQVNMGAGLKAFVEFRERFYPDILFTGQLLESAFSQDKIYYDAAFDKDSNKNILGLFTVGEKATQYTKLSNEEAILNEILRELDEMFDGQASQNYVQHVIQNWSAEPYIRGSYPDDFSGNQEDIVDAIKAPIDNKIYFAGEALSIDNQSTVHGASETAYVVMRDILQV
ncbi:MAG: NAD(P)/FAD-dependent oxidoreductase, partial [Bacteroidota bacterium]